MTAESVQQATRRLLGAQIRQGFVPKALHTYVDAEGRPIYWRARLEDPRGDKCMRPIHLNGNGYELTEPKFAPQSKPLYNLDKIAAEHRAPIFVVEGEKCADAIAKLGGVATTSGSASSDRDVGWHRRYVTYCARRARYAAMNGAASSVRVYVQKRPLRKAWWSWYAVDCRDRPEPCGGPHHDREEA